MKKIALMIGTFIFSVSVFASTGLSHQIGSAILNAAKNKTPTAIEKVSSGMVYGGRDFSRANIASANESVWPGNSTLIG